MDEFPERPATWLVVNEASGSNSAAAVTAILKALADAGHAPSRVVRFPEENLPDRAALEVEGVGLLVTFTGDGTINAQVARIHDWQGYLLVLPGGTKNLLAKSLHGEVGVATIIERLGAGELRPREDARMIRSTHGDALCEIVVGPGARWSDVRETIRYGDVAAVATTLAEAIRQSAGGPQVVVAEPALGKVDGYPAVRLSPAGQAMTVQGYRAEGLVDYARQGVAILKRDFRRGPHDELGAHPAVVCRSTEAIELMIDGERRRGEREERFVIAPCPVRFYGAR